ncbi:MAG: vitamin K epoxide reductase family protein [Chloroflexota bacterium]|nr:vitamin K epoxide reductase family protein [Chloroflexota bacterium]
MMPASLRGLPPIATAEDGLADRRWVVGLSLVGMASMAAVSLLQTGVVGHLPDPPLPGFNSDKVNLSKTAFPLGIPDGTLGLLSFALNLPLAAYGPADRARRMPWLPVLGTAKALIDSVVSAWYFYQMPAREKAWCAYCVLSAFANFGILAASLPEGRRALARLRGA